MSAAGAAKRSGTILMPVSPDLVLLRGIMNSAQLERELMPMIANAFMFNPGECDVVIDTCEMYEDVSAAIDRWKVAEKAVETRGRPAEDEDACATTKEDESKSRRRRKQRKWLCNVRPIRR